ncbi:DUF4062 domain-containing protein [Vibrio parahaemolyticus]|nr:DUF4062 domain-containing protein [Vibrio parahaemolyticus]MBM4904449.1 DUF4062 domain-containing protein [Vibrio parahaemolyticus]HCG7674831.1 DUF4062 domain-containing protein [Vibrio parahaemolyticus]HCG7960655.1 DUF4062 domain-containing protein [Vibrio parahaemolyticus]
MKKRLQVFISSTYLDLIEERQAAVSAVLKSGHIPAGMELFSASDKSQLDIIKRWIDESDVYMLILGGRYGSVEPDSGVSYTELEYNYALEIEKPLFAVVINDDALELKAKKEGLQVIERERQAELKLFREKVLSNMSGFFDDIKDIKLCVMESLPEIASTRTLSGWVSGSEVPDTKGLVDEISKLNAEIADLVKENANLTKKLAMNPKITSQKEFRELTRLLESIKIKLPAKMTGGEKNVEHNLFELFLMLQEYLVTGVTNKVGQDESYYFLYENICPKLQIHGLVQNEKVPSVRWRRFAITKKGEQYLAHIERVKLGMLEEKSSESPNS